MQRKFFLIAAAAGVLLAGCASAQSAVQFQSLDNTANPLRTAFNRDVNKTRLLLLVSPTCGLCLRGTSQVQNVILAHETSPALSAYVVWVPELGAKINNVPGGMTLIPDKRALNYWDADELLGNAYKQILPTPSVAWDVYLLFRPGVVWKSGAPPKPDYWMHQLSGATGPHLDPNVLKRRVDQLL